MKREEVYFFIQPQIIEEFKRQCKRHKLKLNDQLEFALEHWISVIRSNVVDGTKKEN